MVGPARTPWKDLAVLSRLHRVRLSPLARTALVLTAAGAVLALTPAPPATSLPLPAAAHDALAQVVSPVTAAAVREEPAPSRVGRRGKPVRRARPGPAVSLASRAPAGPARPRPGRRPPPGRAREGASPRRRRPAAAARTSNGQETGRRPSPTGTTTPTSERTIEWQKASATTVPTTVPSGSRVQPSSSRVRTVVAPSRRLQNAAKSCSPSSAWLASCMAATSSGRRCTTVSCRRSGSSVSSRSHRR